MAKNHLQRLAEKFGQLTEPLDLARRKICELIEGDKEKAKQRYLEFKRMKGKED